MKRILLLGALLAVAAACGPAVNTNTNTNQPASNTNAAATPTPATVSAKDIIDKENQVFDALKRKDWDAFAAFLADDQIYVTADGVHDKAKSLEIVKKLDITEFSLTDTKVLNVDKDLVVITYTSNAKGSYDGKPIPSTMRESSAWVNRGGTWKLALHQDSEVQTAPDTTPSFNPTPADSEVQTIAPPADTMTATEREKWIWDALKRKDWNGFASMLAADAIEVEPSGVYDKQGSVNGVKKIDFSKVSVSDFKETKLHTNATLVTYMVKGPRPVGPKGDRHSTIWANRSGKWLAVFHQGTEIK